MIQSLMALIVEKMTNEGDPIYSIKKVIKAEAVDGGEVDIVGDEELITLSDLENNKRDIQKKIDIIVAKIEAIKNLEK